MPGKVTVVDGVAVLVDVPAGWSQPIIGNRGAGHGVLRARRM